MQGCDRSIGTELHHLQQVVEISKRLLVDPLEQATQAGHAEIEVLQLEELFIRDVD